MGSCLTKDKNSKTIESKLKQNEKYEKTLNKLLFLGPGGGGKSTIFKQLEWLHDGAYDEKQAVKLRQQIYMQIITTMKNAIKYYLTDKASNDNLQKEIDKVREYQICHFEMSTTIPQDIKNAIAYIWQNDDRMHGIFEKAWSETAQTIEPTTEYFLDSIKRITASDYVPTMQDIINLRMQTTGVIQKKFTINKTRFHIVDVGGQKSERKKWMRCFQEVKAVAFVVCLASYNQNMFEDQNKNCMIDAMELFDQTINNKYFKQTPIILFLNKKDLFGKKIKEISLTVCPAFEDYDNYNHDANVNETKDATDIVYKDEIDNSKLVVKTTSFIEQKFKAFNQSERSIFTHVTCAMEQKNIQHVFNDVALIVINDIKNYMKQNQMFS